MKGRTRTAIGVLFSLLLLWWALRDVALSEVLTHARDADPGLFILSIVLTLAGFWVRAFRWGLLLLPVASLPFSPRVGATFIGFAANNLLPARIGEFARAFSLSRATSVSVAAAFATLVVERLLDGLVLVGLLFASMAAATFPASAQIGSVDLRSAAALIAIIMAAVAAGLFFAVSAPRYAGLLARRIIGLLPARFQEGALHHLRAFAAGLLVLRSPRLFVVSAGLALAQWLFLALSYGYGFRAFGIDDVPYAGAVFMQSLISLAVAIPSSPGFFGPFEAAARAGLGLWGVPPEQAVSFAIGYHIAGFLPVTLIGIYYVWKLDLRWSDLRESGRTIEEGGKRNESRSALEPGGGHTP